MPLRLVAVDMDGTFLRPDMTYDRQRFLALRQRMCDADIRFVVASGNQYWQLTSFFEPADEVAYAAENGHFLYDVGDTVPFYAPTPRPDAARAMIQALEERRQTYLVSTADGGPLAPCRAGRGLRAGGDQRRCGRSRTFPPAPCTAHPRPSSCR